MLPAHERPGHFTAIDKVPTRYFPDMTDCRKSGLFVSEDYRNAAGSPADLLADLLLSRAIER